jgi:hypothetical protein
VDRGGGGITAGETRAARWTEGVVIAAGEMMAMGGTREVERTRAAGRMKAGETVAVTVHNST